MTSATAEQETHSEEHSDHGHGGHEKPRYDDINVPAVVMVGFISAVLSLVTIFFVQGLCYQWHNSYIRDRSTDYVNKPVKEVIDGQRAMLAGDTEKGIISVDETMKKVVEEFGKK